ncbi:MAG: DUF2306 domain-containing protein [Pseudomonadota bacterium]
MNARAINNRITAGLSGLAIVLSVGVALVSYRYLSPTNLFGPPDILGNLFARPWLAIHAGGAATALLVGGFQLIPALRRRRALHRWLGRVYATGCIVGGFAGLTLAFGSTAGPIAGWGFGLLAVAWIYTTAQGWLTGRARRFDEHRRWMIRSFALTFAAVTLRLYLPAGAMAGIDGQLAYRAIAWLCWVPNLALAELYLRRGLRAPRQLAA